MPVIQVDVWEGWGPQKAKAAIEGITQVFVDLGVPARAVEVQISTPRSNLTQQPVSNERSNARSCRRGCIEPLVSQQMRTPRWASRREAASAWGIWGVGSPPK